MHNLKYTIKRILKLLFPVIDISLLPLNVISLYWLKQSRKQCFKYQPLTKNILFKIGVFPIIDHYYEPLFNPKYLFKSLREDRNLPAIDFNVSEQLAFLNKLNY